LREPGGRNCYSNVPYRIQTLRALLTLAAEGKLCFPDNYQLGLDLLVTVRGQKPDELGRTRTGLARFRGIPPPITCPLRHHDRTVVDTCSSTPMHLAAVCELSVFISIAPLYFLRSVRYDAFR
jgi:hypothetical protein